MNHRASQPGYLAQHRTIKRGENSPGRVRAGCLSLRAALDQELPSGGRDHAGDICSGVPTRASSARSRCGARMAVEDCSEPLERPGPARPAPPREVDPVARRTLRQHDLARSRGDRQRGRTTGTGGDGFAAVAPTRGALPACVRATFSCGDRRSAADQPWGSEGQFVTGPKEDAAATARRVSRPFSQDVGYRNEHPRM